MKSSFTRWSVSVAVVKISGNDPPCFLFPHQVEKLLKQIWPRSRQHPWTYWTGGPEKGQRIEPLDNAEEHLEAETGVVLLDDVCRLARHAPGIDKHHGLQMLGVLEGVAAGEVAAKAVAQEDDLLEAEGSAPEVDGEDELGLGLARVLAEVTAGTAREARQVNCDDGSVLTGSEAVDVEGPEARPSTHAVHHDQGGEALVQG